MKFAIEGFCEGAWHPASDVKLVEGEYIFGDKEFDNQDRATKVAWRFRVLMDVPVRLLQDGEVLWSDSLVGR